MARPWEQYASAAPKPWETFANSEWRGDTSGRNVSDMEKEFIAKEGKKTMRQQVRDTPVSEYVKEPLRFAAETAVMPLNALGRGIKSAGSMLSGGLEALQQGDIDAGLQKYQQKQAEFQPLQSPMAPSAMGNMISAGATSGIKKLSDMTGRPDIVEPVAQGVMDIGALVGLNKARPAIGEAVKAGGRSLADLGIATAGKAGITPEKLYASSLKQSTVIPMQQRAANVKTGLEGGYVPNKKGLGRLYDDINVVNQEIAGVLEEAATRGKAADSAPMINEMKAIDTALAGEQTRAAETAQNKAIQLHMIRNEGGHWMQKTNIPDASYYANLRKAYEALPPEKQIQGGLPAPETVTSPIIDNFNAKKVQLQEAIDNVQATGKTIPVADILARLDEVKQRAIDSFGDNGAVLKTIRGFERSLQKHPSVVNGEIPIDVAQQMKVNTYKQLKNAYGELKGFEVEAKKAMARGAKEEIVAQIPELAGLNAKDSTLINLEKVLFKAVNRIENRDMMGIGVPIKALAGGQAGIKGMVLGTIVGLIDTPTIKANIAIALHKARGKAATPKEVNAMTKSIKASLQQKLNDERGLVGRDISGNVTPELKQWAGETTVVDKSGAPKEVYHATNKNFDEFNPQRAGTSSILNTGKERVLWFTDNAKNANQYADHLYNTSKHLDNLSDLRQQHKQLLAEVNSRFESGDYFDKAYELSKAKNISLSQASKETIGAQKYELLDKLEQEILGGGDPLVTGQGRNIMPVYLKMENPLIVDVGGKQTANVGRVKRLAKEAKRTGHDGLVLKNTYDFGPETNTHYVVFSPEQVKSSIGNNGKFSSLTSKLTE